MLNSCQIPVSLSLSLSLSRSFPTKFCVEPGWPSCGSVCVPSCQSVWLIILRWDWHFTRLPPPPRLLGCLCPEREECWFVIPRFHRETHFRFHLPVTQTTFSPCEEETNKGVFLNERKKHVRSCH